MDVVLHRARFVPVSPSGVVASALHPDGHYLALARGNGDLELWTTDGGAPGPLTAPPVGPPSSSPSSPGWAVVASIPGSASLSLHCLAWVGVKSRSLPGVDGARLFLGSLNGPLYEADWPARRLRHAADSNAGPVWSLAATSLSRTSGVAGAGGLLAAGCEDGSVRILRVATHAHGAEHVVGLPGTEGRVLCCGWHPLAPVLFAGTATGAVRGWDLTPLAQVVVGSYEAGQAERSAAAAARARARAASVSALQEGKRSSAGSGLVAGRGAAPPEDSSDDESSEEEAGPQASGTALGGRSAGRGSTVGPAPVVHFRVDPHSLGGKRGGGGGKKKKGAAPSSCVWSLAVASDMTVVTADSTGAVQAWDGRTGVLSSSVPLALHDGDALCLVLVEERGAGEGGEGGTTDARRPDASPPTRLIIASGGVDGRVILLSSLPAQQRAWVQLGAHSAHSGAVRALALCVHSAGRGGGPSGSGSGWLASGAADGNLVSTLVSDLSAASGGAPPRSHAPISRQEELVSVSGGPGAGLIAAYEGAAVRVWAIRQPAPSGRAGAGTLEPSLLLQIDVPSVGGAEGGDSAPSSSPPLLPLAQPGVCTLSPDGRWLAYAGGCDPLPRLVYLHPVSVKGEVVSLTPVHVRVGGEEALLLATSHAALRLSGGARPGVGEAAGGAAARAAKPGPPSKVALVAVGPCVTLLLAVSCGRLFVTVCCAGEGGREGAATGLPLKPSAAYAYSLPIPTAHAEAVRVEASGTARTLLAASQGVEGGAGGTSSSTSGRAPPPVALAVEGGGKRRRSATADSTGLASAAMSESEYAGSADGEESQGEGAGSRGGDAPLTAPHAPLAGNAICLPLVLTAGSVGGEEGGAYACVATSTRHAHVYTLHARHGALSHSLPRLHTTPAAAAFTPHGTALFIALRDASLLAFEPGSGRLLPWSPAKCGTGVGREGAPVAGAPPTLPKAWQARLRADPPVSIVPLTAVALSSAEGHLSPGTSVKLLCAGRDTVATLSIACSTGGAGQQQQAGAAAVGKGGQAGKSGKPGKAGTSPPLVGVTTYACTAAVSEGYDNVLLAGLACGEGSLGVSGGGGRPTGGGAGVKRGREEAEGKRAPLVPAAVAIVHVPTRVLHASLGLRPTTTAAATTHTSSGAGGGEEEPPVDVATRGATLARLGQQQRKHAKYGRG